MNCRLGHRRHNTHSARELSHDDAPVSIYIYVDALPQRAASELELELCNWATEEAALAARNQRNANVETKECQVSVFKQTKDSFFLLEDPLPTCGFSLSRNKEVLFWMIHLGF